MKKLLRKLTLFLLISIVCYTYFFLNQESKTIPIKGNTYIVVLGASVWNNKPSDSLRIRLDKAAEILNYYKEKDLYPTIVLSGGYEETPVMKNYLVKTYNIKEQQLIQDPYGNNTRKTAEFVKNLKTPNTILAVSHFYHLARIKLSFKQNNINVLCYSARPWKKNLWEGSNKKQLLREMIAYPAYLLKIK